MRLPLLGTVVLATTRAVEAPASTEPVVDLKLERPGGRLQVQQPLQAMPRQLRKLRTTHRIAQRCLTGRQSFCTGIGGPNPALVGRKDMMNLRSSTEQRSIRPWQDLHKSQMILPPIELSFSRHLHMELLHCIFLPIDTMRSL